MRRLALPLLAVLCCYALYCATLPETAPSVASWSPGTTAELTLPAAEIHSVALGPFSTAEEARATGALRVSRGAAACVRKDGAAYWTLLCLCRDESAARSAQAQLRANDGLDVAVYETRFDASTVRIQASENQIAALSDVLALLENAPGQLNALAEQIDRSGGDVASARTLAAVLSGDVRAVREELELQIAGTENAFCKAVSAAVLYLDEALDSSLRTASALCLSSAFRQIALETSFAPGELGTRRESTEITP